MLDALIGHASGVMVRYIVLAKGEREEPHAHPFAHVTLLAHGRAKMLAFDNAAFSAPHLFEIPADVTHGFEAEEDGTVIACIINTKDYQRATGVAP